MVASCERVGQLCVSQLDPVIGFTSYIAVSNNIRMMVSLYLTPCRRYRVLVGVMFNLESIIMCP